MRTHTYRTHLELTTAILKEIKFRRITQYNLFLKIRSSSHSLKFNLKKLEKIGFLKITKKEVPLKNILSDNPRTKIQTFVEITPQGKEFLEEAKKFMDTQTYKKWKRA